MRSHPPRRRRRFFLLAGVGLLAAGLLYGRFRSKPENPPGLPGSAPFVTFVLLDGVGQKVLDELVAAGRMPTYQRLLARGARVENGIGAFPSITGYAYYPFITGHDAAESGIFGLRWFDRGRASGLFRNYVGLSNVHMNSDLRPRPTTIFEQIGPQHSSSFNSYLNRGVVRSHLGGFDFTMAKFGDRYWFFRTLAFFSFLDPGLAPTWEDAEDHITAQAIADLALRPKVQWLTFTSPDGYHHLGGTDATYRQIIQHLDRLLARYLDASSDVGRADRQVLAIVSDHGMVDVTQNLDPCRDLERLGVRLRRGSAVQWNSGTLDVGAKDLEDYDGVFAINGNTTALIYLRQPGSSGMAGWETSLDSAPLRNYRSLGRGLKAPAHDLVRELLTIKGVELVALRSDRGSVAVFSSVGEAVIDKQNDAYRYRPRGPDPFGYRELPDPAALLDQRFHDRRQWLTSTQNTTYPYAVVRLHAIMTQPGSPDLLITAAPGYDFGRDFEMFVGNYRGGHGGLRADQLRVHYLLLGPGVRAGARLPVATAEDLGATIRHLAGLPAAPELSGRVLTEILVEPETGAAP